MVNRFEQWLNLFEKAWKVRVIENEHLMYPCFIEFLSAMNNDVRYVYSGEYKKTHICSLKIQASGTGKGVGDKLVADCLNALGYKATKLSNFTEAGIVGSLRLVRKGEPEVVYGELKDNDFIWIDEARQLFVGNAWSQGLLEVLNGYFDDGVVYKRLAQGEISYISSCVIGTGTFFFDKLKQNLLGTGFFQRALVTYKDYAKEDVVRISGEYDNLVDNDYLKDFKPIINEMIELNKTRNLTKYCQEGTGKYVIKLNSEASKKLGKMIDNYFNENLAGCFGNDSLNNAMGSCLIRSKEIGHKIMTLYAVFNEDDEAGDDSADFAFEMVKNHLNSMRTFIDDAFEQDKFRTFDTDVDKAHKVDLTKNTLKRVIREHPGITHSEIKKYIEDNRDMFVLGITAILKHLSELIKDGAITPKEDEQDKRITKYYTKNTI